MDFSSRSKHCRGRAAGWSHCTIGQPDGRNHDEIANVQSLDTEDAEPRTGRCRAENLSGLCVGPFRPGRTQSHHRRVKRSSRANRELPNSSTIFAWGRDLPHGFNLPL